MSLTPSWPTEADKMRRRRDGGELLRSDAELRRRPSGAHPQQHAVLFGRAGGAVWLWSTGAVMGREAEKGLSSCHRPGRRIDGREQGRRGVIRGRREHGHWTSKDETKRWVALVPRRASSRTQRWPDDTRQHDIEITYRGSELLNPRMR